MNRLFNRNVSYEFLWLAVSLVPLLLISLLLPLTPHDYWWYLRLGHDVIQLGSVPSVDTYSFSEAGQSIINQPWLSAVIFWVAYHDGGLNLTFLLRAVCIGAAYGLLWVWMREMRAGTRLVSILVIVSGLSTSNNWSFRPQLFAYPLFALSLFILWRWEKESTGTGPERRTSTRNQGTGWLLWVLPVIALLWANLHESFLLLFVLEGAALVFGRGNRKRLILVMLACFLTTLITPYDVFLWASLIRTYIANPGWDSTSEWLPPSNLGWQMNIFFGWVLAFIPLAALSKKRLSLLEWVWLLGLLWMAFSGVRYVIWGMFLLAGFSAYLLSNWDVPWLNRPKVAAAPPIASYAVAALALLIPFVALPSFRARLGVQSSPPISWDTPVAATTWLSQHPELPGPMWSDVVFSSYLIFSLPERTVWIDTRFGMVYSPGDYARYLAVANADPGWEGVLDRTGINLIMLSVNGEPDLLQSLKISADWCQVYGDPVAAIFVRAAAGQSCALQ